jgi:hypothetical protein
MAENHDLLKCPVCQGHGEVLRSEVVEQLTSGELKSRLDAVLAEIVPPETSPAVIAHHTESPDFQRDVHSWNAQLPMWRRSPKE